MTVDLLADFRRYVEDVQQSNGYLAWARDNHGPKNDPNYSISTPKPGSELAAWYLVRDAVLAGGRPTLPTLGTTFGCSLIDVAREHLDATAPVDTPPPPPPPPPPVGLPTGVGRWDVPRFSLDSTNASLRQALLATAGVQGCYVVCGVARAFSAAQTPLVSVTTSEAITPVKVPLPAGVKHGSSYDKLLQVFAPDGSVYSLSSCSDDCRSTFGATRIAAPDAMTGLYWGEPGPNSTSAGRIPFGWFDADDVLQGRFKTLAFCAPNLSHAASRYPADPSAGTNFPITVPSLPTGVPLGTMWRLPAGTVIPPLDAVETYIATCVLKHGAVVRDIGSTWGFYGIDYINQGGNVSGWKPVMPVEQMNGSLPYAHKLSAAFNQLMRTVECVTGVTP